MMAYMPATALALPSVPEWVRVVPAGASYTLANARTIIASSLRDGGDKLWVDENHATEMARVSFIPAPACGWMDRMEAREDGIWAHVSWAPKGRLLISNREYGWVVPVVDQNESGVITRVVSAALSNRTDRQGVSSVSLHITDGGGGVIVLTSEDVDVCKRMGINPDAMLTYKKLGRDHARMEDRSAQTAMGLSDVEIDMCRKMNLSPVKFAEHKTKVEAELAATGAFAAKTPLS